MSDFGNIFLHVCGLSQLQTITQSPERMYKIVLAGDAAVGKSSFIMRLCKGRFLSNLTSTLGRVLLIVLSTIYIGINKEF